MTREEYISGLRAVADWFEAHPELPTPNYWDVFVGNCDKKTLGLAARALGKATKSMTDSYFSILGKVGGASLTFYNSRREICERVLVGTKVIPAYTRPAMEETVVPEKVEEIYEWKCPESLLAGGAA